MVYLFIDHLVHTHILKTHSTGAGYTPALMEQTALNISTFTVTRTTTLHGTRGNGIFDSERQRE